MYSPKYIQISKYSAHTVLDYFDRFFCIFLGFFFYYFGPSWVILDHFEPFESIFGTHANLNKFLTIDNGRINIQIFLSGLMYFQINLPLKNERIFWQMNISVKIYSNIQIFVPHWYRCPYRTLWVLRWKKNTLKSLKKLR